MSELVSQPPLGADVEVIRELIHRRRRQIIVHSVLYYRLDETLISDSQFDSWSIELVKLQRDYPELAMTVGYEAEAFSGFTGSTGFDLPIDDPRVIATARRLLARHKELEKRRGTQQGAPAPASD